MVVPAWLPPLYSLAIWPLYVLGANDTSTKHEAGRCAMRAHCGKQSFFGGELPCLDNGLAKEPDKDLRDKIVSICGDSWADEQVCCDEDQVGISI